MLVLILLLSAGRATAQTLPGTEIDNVATLRWDVAGVAASAASNLERVVVAERLDVAMAGAVAPAADGVRVVTVAVTDTGSATESYAMTATVVGPGATPAGSVVLVVDGDGDGRYDPARDPPLENALTPMLEAGETVALLALVTGAAAGTVTVTAQATTGAGDPGTVFDGRGDGGGDAVVGATGAMASVALPLVAAPVAPTFAKRQSVLAPDGSARPVSGAIVTYALDVAMPGPAAGVVCEDRVPAGTSYVPGSLRLDDRALSDAADGDAGEIADGLVSVRLPDATPDSAPRTIQFAVRLP